MRIGEHSTKNNHGSIKITINLDGKGKINIDTGIKFFNHLLTTLGTHSLIDITLSVIGDLTQTIIEEIAIGLGCALRKAIEKGERINQFGYAIVPMDCSLAFTALDLGKQRYQKIDLQLRGDTIEDMKQEDILHFLETFATSLQLNLHLWVQYGNNDHHKVEAAFKSFALALKEAITLNPQ
jgi:imidazoleglycerol-phosphate dehydratase